MHRRYDRKLLLKKGPVFLFSWQIYAIWYLWRMGHKRKASGKKQITGKKKCWFACGESICGRCCWSISCIHYFLSAEVPHPMFCFMTFYKLFSFSQWSLNEILLHHGRYNPSGKPGPKRRLSIQSICTINPMTQACGLLLKNILYPHVWRAIFYRQNDEFFPQEADIFHTNKNYSAETQFSVKTILTKNFQPSVLHHHSE